MGATASFINQAMDLYFNNNGHANVGDATGLLPSGAPGNFWISLHTANPDGGTDQTANEIDYTGYGRVSVVRSSGGWTVSAGNAENLNAITFGQMTAGTGGQATYVGIGFAETGVGSLDFSAEITTPAGGIAVTNGITPEVAAGALDITLQNAA